jgi:hypothetical protein
LSFEFLVLSYICPSVLPENLRFFVELFGKKISAKIVSAYEMGSKKFEKNFIFDKSARKKMRICAVLVDTECMDLLATTKPSGFVFDFHLRQRLRRDRSPRQAEKIFRHGLTSAVAKDFRLRP